MRRRLFLYRRAFASPGSGLTNITIPDSVTEIKFADFEYCSSLKSVTIGNGVTVIRDYAFNGCKSLKSIHYGGKIAQWNELLEIFAGKDWNASTPYYTVYCTDGTLTKAESY